MTIDTELNEILQNKATKLGISKSALVRIMINDQLKAEDNLKMLQSFGKALEDMNESEIKNMITEITSQK